MFSPKSPDYYDWDSKDHLIFPDIPPPVPPRKKITNQVTIPDDRYEDDVFKYSRAGKPIARRVSIDLITFEDDTEAEESTPIISKCSENSSVLDSRNLKIVQPINVAKTKKKEIQDMRHESFMENLDEFLQDDLFKSPFNGVDSEKKKVQLNPEVCIFSPKETTLQHVRDDDAINPFPSVSEFRKWSSRNPFLTENFALELQFPDDNKTKKLHQKAFDGSQLHCEEGVIKSSTDSKAEETKQFGSWENDDIISYEGNSWPHVRVDLGLDPFTSATSVNEDTKQTHACQYTISDVLDYSRMHEHQLRKHDEDESGYLVFKSSQQYDKATFKYGFNTQARETHQRKELPYNEEDDYICMGPARNTEISSEYKSHMNKVDEKQQRNQKADLESDTVENPVIPDTCRQSILSQRSLSDSAINMGDDVDSNKTQTCGKYEHSEINQEKTSQSKDNIKYKVKSIWSKFAKRIVKNSQQTSPEQADWQTKLVCACGGSCERIGSLALLSSGNIWVAFQHCSWVSEYDHEYIPVRKFDAGGIVDCLAVSPTGVLYISCPMKKHILMLSKNRELITIGKFNKLHPRGLDISPIDGAVVVCMTSQMVGNVMKGPSKNCLMKFAGKKANEEGQVLNKENFLGYPQRLVINVNGYILVSDFGLKCIFVVSQEGLMLNMFSTVGDGRFCQVHSLTSGHGGSFYVVHGGRGKLLITRLSEHRGTVVENATSRRVDPDIHFKVRATAVKQNGQLAVASGTLIKYVTLD